MTAHEAMRRDFEAKYATPVYGASPAQSVFKFANEIERIAKQVAFHDCRDDAWRYMFCEPFNFKLSKRKPMHFTETMTSTVATSEDIAKIAAEQKAQEERAAKRKALNDKKTAKRNARNESADMVRYRTVHEARNVAYLAGEAREHLAQTDGKSVSSFEASDGCSSFTLIDHEIVDENNAIDGYPAPTAIELKKRELFAKFTEGYRLMLTALAADLETLAASTLKN